MGHATKDEAYTANNGDLAEFSLTCHSTVSPSMMPTQLSWNIMAKNLSLEKSTIK